MPERSNGAVSKTVEPIRVPGVRIPLSPPQKTKAGKAGPTKENNPENKFICFSGVFLFAAQSAVLFFVKLPPPQGTPSASGAKVIPWEGRRGGGKW